jgi:hypothetical protein
MPFICHESLKPSPFGVNCEMRILALMLDFVKAFEFLKKRILNFL